MPTIELTYQEYEELKELIIKAKEVSNRLAFLLRFNS